MTNIRVTKLACPCHNGKGSTMILSQDYDIFSLKSLALLLGYDFSPSWEFSRSAHALWCHWRNRPSAAVSSIGTPILKNTSNGLHCELDLSSSHRGLHEDCNGLLLCSEHWLRMFPIVIRLDVCSTCSQSHSSHSARCCLSAAIKKTV